MKSTWSRALIAAGLLTVGGAAQAVQILGITTDNRIATFDSATPGVWSPLISVTGVTPGARIVGIDTRPGDSMVYGVGTDNKLYTIDPMTGAATFKVNLTGATIESGLAYGIDFNPVADAGTGASLRLISSAGNNYAVNANTGVIGNTSSTIQPNIGGVAYTNSGVMPAPASTQLYYIDFATDRLRVANGAFNAPSLIDVGPLGLDTIGAFGFDILADGRAFAGLTSGITGQSGFYSINLTTGAATLVGEFGAATPLLAGMTAVVPEAEAYALMLAGLGLIGWQVRRQRQI
ncbi:MAG: DUF4394 domain-containing protein [Thiobacillus sp.]|nr:DUF4394 domain-containing protein [Thiobacillus sp.]